MKKLGTRVWLTLIIVGLVGQFAWTIENMYLNVYLYNTISTDPTYIATMVAASAIAATLTTLIIGGVTDRAGKRKPFIAWGYILWGLTVVAFGFVTPEAAGAVFPAVNAAAAAATLVVILDCVMTFFGSTANDAAFNAYVTDVTDQSNRGRAESVLAVLPLLSILVIFGAFDGMTQQGRWKEFFTIFGLLVTATGIIALFLVKDGEIEKKKEPFLKNLLYGFTPSVVRQNGRLYLSLTAMCLFSVAVQVFFPYLIIYMQNYLKLDSYAIVLGIVLIFASLVSVLSGGLLDRLGRLNCMLPAAGIMLAGLVGMYFVRSFVGVIAAGAVMMSGYMLATAILSATVRDYTPKDKIGHFQGVRMIFAVLLPMVIGPYIGAAVIKNSAETYVELGVVKTVPTPAIFLAAAAVLLAVVVPVLLLRRNNRAEQQV